MNVCNKCSFWLVFSFFVLYYVTKHFVQTAEDVSPDNNVNATSLLPSKLKKEEIIHVTTQAIVPNDTHLLNATEKDKVAAKVLIVRDNPGCDCVNTNSSNNCGCCATVDIWADIIDGKFCANATYLSKDMGFSVTVTYNNKTIVNETVTASDPPPFCVYALEELEIDICLQLHKVNFTDGFSGCAELEIRVFHVRVMPSKIKLGCFDVKYPSLILNEVRLISNKIKDISKQVKGTSNEVQKTFYVIDNSTKSNEIQQKLVYV